MIVVHKGHRVHLGEQYEMGEGVESYSPSCDCGWTGIPVDTHADPRYGAQGQKPLPGHVGGDNRTAMLQVLTHVDYDPPADESLYRNGLNQLIEDFFATDETSLTWSNMDIQARILERGMAELRDVRYRQMLWATREETV